MNEKVRQLPAQSPRVETGPIKFGDDWTSVRIRGDNAAYYAFVLCQIIEHLQKIDPVFVQRFDINYALQSLLSDLSGSYEGTRPLDPPNG